MEELTIKLEEFLGEKRDWTKSMFKIAGSIIRGVKNNRFTLEYALEEFNKLGGVN